MEIKRFSTPDPIEGDPIPFVVEYVAFREETFPAGDDGSPPGVRKVKERREQTFHAKPDLSGGQVVQIDLMSAGGRGGVNARGGDALYDFFDAALIDGDREAFRKLIEDPDVFVHAKTLSEIAVWLYTTYTARHPT